MTDFISTWQGRQLLAADLPEISEMPREAVAVAAMTALSARRIRCNRCGTVHQTQEVRLPVGAAYCPTCISLGRIRSDEPLYRLRQVDFPRVTDVLRWSGQLTAHQAEVSSRLRQAVGAHEQLLVAAVTGAGKTEMTYEAVARALADGQAVAIASPRIDVVKELQTRFRRDFALDIPCLYGGSAPYFRAPLTIMTTHQLLRFHAAFDLLIIDEVDAFPFADNDALYFAAKNAQKPGATLIYLTATSTAKLDAQIRSGQLTKVALSRRFHDHPLVVPQLLWHKKFSTELDKQRQTGFPLLIFAPEIDSGQTFARQLQITHPEQKIGFAASTTPHRHALVEDFRQRKLDILVATTILERGVTFPAVDVFVWQADHRAFTRSALIQMAGRVGRSPDRPTGRVAFFHAGKSRAMTAAVAEIRAANLRGGF